MAAKVPSRQPCAARLSMVRVPLAVAGSGCPAVTDDPAGVCHTGRVPGVSGCPGCQSESVMARSSCLARWVRTSRSAMTTSRASGKDAGRVSTRSGPMPAGSPQVMAMGRSGVRRPTSDVRLISEYPRRIRCAALAARFPALPRNGASAALPGSSECSAATAANACWPEAMLSCRRMASERASWGLVNASALIST